MRIIKRKQVFLVHVFDFVRSVETKRAASWDEIANSREDKSGNESLTKVTLRTPTPNKRETTGSNRSSLWVNRRPAPGTNKLTSLKAGLGSHAYAQQHNCCV